MGPSQAVLIGGIPSGGSGLGLPLCSKGWEPQHDASEMSSPYSSIFRVGTDEQVHFFDTFHGFLPHDEVTGRFDGHDRYLHYPFLTTGY